MDIKTFNIVAPNLPADIAVLMRGPTGVGKSHLGKAVADAKGLPFIDIRMKKNVKDVAARKLFLKEVVFHDVQIDL